MPHITIAQAKSHFSELIAKSLHGHERYIITRRNKPVAALVTLDDLRIIEQHIEKQGLAAISGAWRDFDEIATVLDDLAGLRQNGGAGRDVSL